MNHPNDAYTIVIFRGAKSNPLRFRIPRSYARRALFLGACLILAEMLLLTQYVKQTGEVWELHNIRGEMLSVSAQTTAFSNALDDLKRRMLAMKEVNQQLRVMLGIEERKPQDLISGQGGEETPIVESQQGPPAKAEESELQTPDQVSLTEGDAAEDPLTRKVQQDLTWLESQANDQERALQELTEAAKKKSARWAALPSIWPVKGWITSRFGPRLSPFTDQRAFHNGLDIGARPNTPIKAAAAGRVRATGFDSMMGNLVLLDHGYGKQTEYAHLSKILVKRGQKVKRGDAIGLLGNTGHSTGPHLHYMVKVNGRAVNPLTYILD
ncbi:MAG: M23 family metallopeptidase [Nitrospiraceae bacterium]